MAYFKYKRHALLTTESDHSGVVRDWLVENGLMPYEGFETGDGPVDLYLGGRRVLIEIKTRKRLKKGPYVPGTGSRPNESAFEQLTRYMVAEISREQMRLDEDPKNHWIGCVTDSVKWWVWMWPPHGYGKDSEIIPEFNGTVVDEFQKKLLIRRFQRLVGKEWAPVDPTNLFNASLVSFKKLYEQRKAFRATKTQQGLWLEQLKASGNAPESDTDEIFVIHTMLILISRLVSATVGRGRPITEGFVQWVQSDGPELNALKGIVGNYDWSQRTGDVLRALYIGYIPPQHRQVYGEYFTPDWLAEKLCCTIIDNRYISQQIKRYNAGQQLHGVLDPACGSGTFLYHAAKRIIESNAIKSSYMESDEMIKFVCAMVHGIDIHPVAVEMALANMHRILPGVPDRIIHVYQGDALLTQRPDSQIHSMGGDNLALFSPGERPLILPKSFLHDASKINKFVNSAIDDSNMPPGLGSGFSDVDLEQLREAHGQMRKIIQNEANGVWAWYIRNQAAPMLLREKKVGRIVSNPPWVRINKIRVEKRKKEIETMAKERGLWVGGETATSFDVASLFVDRCTALYLTNPNKSGWVLPHGAMFGGGWDGFRNRIGDKISSKWNLKRLPFKLTPTCAMLFGVNIPNRDLAKMPRTRLNSTDSWKTAQSKTKWIEWPQAFPEEKSSWLDNNKKPIARVGATIFPHCLVRIKTKTVEYNNTRFETTPSMHLPWNKFGSQHGTVPSEWIRECLFFIDLLPYMIPTTTPCVLPISGNAWDIARMTNPYWQEATDLYTAHHGRGSNTPHTLEGNLNFSNKLLKQIERKGEHVLYNKSGDVLHAARVNYKHMINDGLYSVPCRSLSEARFLTAILNADIMLQVFRAARESDRDFAAHIWRKVPIPRYDGSQLHYDLANLSKQAENIAKRTYTPTYGKHKMRSEIRKALQKDGVAGQIDDICKKLFQKHTRVLSS